MSKVLVFDTETGGLDPSKHAILSIGMCVWNDGAVEDRLSVLINEGDLTSDSVTAEALKVNGLSIDRITSEGAGVYDAVTLIEQLLLRNGLYQRRVTLAGHNVAFDIGFLRRLFRLAGKEKAYGKLFSHRSICTQTLALALELAGRVKWLSTSLDVLTKHFGIHVRDGGAAGKHDALEDAEATAALLNSLLKYIKDPSQPMPLSQVEMGDKDADA